MEDRLGLPYNLCGGVKLFSGKQSSQLQRLLAVLERGHGEAMMTVEQAIRDISALPPKDQLRIVQAIWDRLPEGVGAELTDSQRAELDRRWAEYKSDPLTALSEEAFRERVRVARGR
jgi:putative addiction module component (TIGR02574 family)